MWITRSTLLASLSLFALASAQGIPFTSPSAGEQITVGESFEITWSVSSSVESVGISMCRGSGQDCNSIANVPNTGSYDWTPSSNLPSDSTYYLIMTGSDGGYLGASATFEIQGSDDNDNNSSSSSSSASSGPSSTTGSSQTSSAASTTSGSTTTSGAATSTPQDGGSSDTGAIVGGAIGAVVVVIAIAVGGFIWMRKKNQKKIAAVRAELGTPSPDDDIEAGKKMKRSSMLGVAGKKDKNAQEEDPNAIQLAELPAMQQEPVEMMAATGPTSSKQNHFFAMELDSKEIPRPGSSTVKPDIDGGVAPKPSMEKHYANRGVSIDGTTVNSETERPKTSGTIDRIKEESRGSSSRELTQPGVRSETPVFAPARATTEEARPTRESTSTPTNGSRPRDSTPQIRSSIPSLPAFDFDSSKF